MADRYTMNLPDAAVSFDVDQFDNAIRNHGVNFVHWRSMRCPVGMIDEYDTRRPHEDHSGCSNSFLYTRAGDIRALFSGNSTGVSMTEIGAMDGSTVTITLPRVYDSGEPVYIAPFDRLYLAEEAVVVVNWQLFRHSISSQDKLSFLAVTVQDLVDAQGRRYVQGQDFEVRQGRINWIGKTPGADPQSGQGQVCSIRYTYRPYWYVKQLVHEVRVSQADNPYTGEREVHRMPQMVVLQREYVFEKQERDEMAPDREQRQVKPPDAPRFGPRF